MEKIIEKLDSYNIFTNIIPGYLMLQFNIYYFKIDNFNIVEYIVIAYFIGQTLNKIGSIIVGKVLLKFTSEKGLPYDEYIQACDNDKKINILLQERNTYRTFCALFVICIIEIIFNKLFKDITISNDIKFIALFTICLIIYCISYCKYNKYIADRIRISNKNNIGKNIN